MPKKNYPGWISGMLGLLVLAANSQAGVLLELYQKALENNPTLLSRKYAIEQAEAREDQAFSRLLPQISANGSYSLNKYHREGLGTNQYEGLRGVVQISQALLDLPSYMRYQSAEASTEQSRGQYDAYIMELAGDLLDRYLQILEANDRIETLTEEKKSVETQIKRLRQMRKRQMVKVTDLYEVEAYKEALNTQIIEAENEKAIALERIREITAVLPEPLAVMSIETFPEVPVDVEQWIKDAVSYNPNLLSLKAALEAADNIIYANRAGHLPQFTLQLSQIYSDQSFDNQPISNPYDIGSINLQLNIPIFSGGRIEAEVREAIARWHQLIQEYERIRRQIERETRTSFLNSISGRARIDSTRRQFEAQEKATKAQKRGYELGVTTIVDLLESRKETVRIKTEHRQACYDYLRSLIALRIWSGGLTMVDIEEIDKWFTL